MLPVFSLLIILITTFFKTYGDYVTNPNSKQSGVTEDTVYINDDMRDWYYYMGLNYTENDGTLPTAVDKKIYSNKNLVRLNITYDSLDLIYNATSYVGISETQSKYVYYKVLNVNDNGTESKLDDYVMLELIDNPFANIPDDLAFNGWITNYENVKLSFDNTYYVRYAKIPVTYNSNDTPSDITITFNASYVPANKVILGQTSWNNALNNLDNAVMKNGDTMTGNLMIKNETPNLELKNTSNDRIGYIAMSPDKTCGFYNYLDPDNRQGLYIPSVETAALVNSIKFLRTVSGTTNYYSIYGTHNITAGTTDLTAGSSALDTGAIYLVYE